ncbi:MAG: Quinoprotein glucose dehydrogenase B [Gemmatimonadaceae bacterium]|nr:Quinoprotein glucose dehydrogenase B [Gemmatimonadaceae bacterium]
MQMTKNLFIARNGRPSVPCRIRRHMKSCATSTSTALFLGLVGCGGATATTPNADGIVVQSVAGGFDTIWSMVWAPDATIWISERPGMVSRVNPVSGSVTRIGQLPVSEIGEGGLMGLALHPDFSTQPWVYAAYTTTTAGRTQNRVVRMLFTGGALGAPEILIDDIPGASVHNGSRLAIGPDRLLYVTTGDAASAESAQDRASLAGKILRVTLDGRPAPGNPFGTSVYSFGHRNPQGISFSPAGTLYETEHGPSDNDEVNRIQAGANYGWPSVRGYCDGDAGPNELRFCQANGIVEPLRAWTPTIAPSGLAFYDSPRIPAWRGSLLFTTLNGRALHRLTISTNGSAVTAAETLFAGEFGRLRDVLVAPDGTVYIATSNKDGRGSPQAGDDRILRIVPK